MRRRNRPDHSILRALSLALPAGLTAAGALPAQAADAPPRARGAPADVAALEAFLDGVMAAHLRDHDVAGATLAIVLDGRLLYSRGYGFADAARQVPVDPATTLFRIGSVTKAFTWVAVLTSPSRSATSSPTRPVSRTACSACSERPGT